ncbi:MAG: hypothetical protein AAFV80_20075 [Bacteroidota bacterium]
MKIRCTNNSIRLRLRKSDIEKLEAEHHIEEVLRISPDTAFRFELAIAIGIPNPNVHQKDDHLIVYLPEAQAKQWMHSNDVGIEHHKSIGEEQLHILIEKDFPCLDRANEDKSDTFWELAKKPDQC